jgi:hypothetical protein
MKEMHPEFKHLPVMSPGQSVYAMKLGGLSPTLVSKFTGISRPTISALWNGHAKGTVKAVQFAISALAYRSLRALKHKNLPLATVRDYPAAFEMLRDGPRYDRPLADYTPGELVPGDRQFDTQRSTNNGTSGIL